MEGAYEGIIKKIIQDLQKSGKKMKDKNIFAKLLMTTFPFKYLQENIDFGLFYEREDEELEKIKGNFAELYV